MTRLAEAGNARAATGAAPAPAARVAAASLIGTAIEFYDFYIYGTAAALAFGPVFFPQESAAAQLLSAFASFSIAFLARPLGAVLFGHFGDRVGRKSTLVASLLIMGVSTTLIGALPGYAQIGYAAPALLCLMRFGQGLGLGGEWGGAALLAVENAPPGRRALFGTFPQFGAPIGFVMANGLFLLLSLRLDSAAFQGWGWRVPFLLSAVLVLVGLYVRLKLTETPAFQAALREAPRLRLPIRELVLRHPRAAVLGTLSMVGCYTLFYLSTVFALGHATATLGFDRAGFLLRECVAILFMAAGIPISAWLSDRVGRRPVLLAGTALAALSGFALPAALGGGSEAEVTAFLCLELFLMGIMFGPMGALLPELFPARLRYTGASVSYNLAGILGASFAPLIAQVLVARGGLAWVGLYLTAAALISFGAVWLLRETARAPLPGA